MILARRTALGRYFRADASVEERNVRNLVIQTAFSGVVGGGVTTFLPIYVTRLGASPLLVGMLTALPAILTMLLALPAGALVARQTHLVRDSARAYLAMRACFLLIAAVAFLPAAWAAPLAVLVWGATAIPGAVANTAWYGVFAEAIPAEGRAALNGLRWGLLGLVTAISVALFGFLLERMPFPLGYQLVFALSFVSGLLSIAFYAKLTIPRRAAPSVTPRAATPLRERLRQTWRPLTERGPFLRFCVSSTILRTGMYLGVGLYSVFWVRDLHATDAVIGLRATVGNAALVVGYPIWGWVATRFGHERALMLAAAGLGLYPIATGMVPSADWLLPAALLWGLFAGGIDVTLFEGLLHSARPEQRAQYVALNTLLANAVAFVGPVLGAALANWWTIPPVLFLAGSLHLAAAATVGLMVRRGRRSRPLLPSTSSGL